MIEETFHGMLVQKKEGMYTLFVFQKDNNEYGNVTELYQLANKIKVFVDNVEWTNVDDTNYNSQTNASTTWLN